MADMKRIQSGVLAVRIEPSLKKQVAEVAKKGKLTSSAYVRGMIALTLGYTDNVLLGLLGHIKQTDEAATEALDRASESLAHAQVARKAADKGELLLEAEKERANRLKQEWIDLKALNASLSVGIRQEIRKRDKLTEPLELVK